MLKVRFGFLRFLEKLWIQLYFWKESSIFRPERENGLRKHEWVLLYGYNFIRVISEKHINSVGFEASIYTESSFRRFFSWTSFK